MPSMQAVRRGGRTHGRTREERSRAFSRSYLPSRAHIRHETTTSTPTHSCAARSTSRGCACWRSSPTGPTAPTKVGNRRHALMHARPWGSPLAPYPTPPHHRNREPRVAPRAVGGAPAQAPAAHARFPGPPARGACVPRWLDGGNWGSPKALYIRRSPPKSNPTQLCRACPTRCSSRSWAWARARARCASWRTSSSRPSTWYVHSERLRAWFDSVVWSTNHQPHQPAATPTLHRRGS